MIRTTASAASSRAVFIACLALSGIGFGGHSAHGANAPVEPVLDARLPALRERTMRLGAEIRDRVAAAAGERLQLGETDRSRLEQGLAEAQALLDEAGPAATPRDRNAVAMVAGGLRLLAGEEGVSFGPSLGSGAISGTVTNANTAAPVAGATVYVYDCLSSYVAVTTTNASGGYTTPAALETGTYTVEVFANGFVTEMYNDIPAPSSDFTVGTPVSVTSGATTSNINVALEPSGSMSGTVVNAATLAPVATLVVVYDASGVSVNSAISGGGAFTVTGLKTGTYYAYAYGASGLLGKLYNVGASCPFNFSCSPTTGTPISVTAGSNTAGVGFALAAGGRISGVVTATTGGAGLTASLTVYNATGASVTSVSSLAASGGVYITDPGLPTGNYFVKISASALYLRELYNNIPCEPSCTTTSGAPVAVSLGSTTPGINFILDTGGSITGTVVDGATAAPISGVSVTAYNAAGPAVRSATTSSPGYIITGLPTGTYYVRATTPLTMNYVTQQYNNIPCLTCASNSGTPVSVTAPATTASINFSLNMGGTIAGRITNALTGAGIGGAYGYAYTSAGGATNRYGYSTCSGDYTVQGLPTDSGYRVYLGTSSNYGPFRQELYDNIDCPYTCSVVTGTAVPVTAGATTADINADLVRYTTVADFDSNRTTDIGVYDPASGIWFVRNQFTQAFGGPGSTIVPGDYDGDRKTDLAVYYEASGLWYVRKSTTSTTLVQGFGGPGYKPVPGDYDGDGKTDFAVFHDASGLWFVKQSSNGATVSFAFGSSGATLVPADYDRDGKTDAAVYYEASGLWYIRQSSSLITFSTGYGGTGYKPVRGDFDGDGRWDIAVYHNASSIWFIRNWGTGATTSVAFGGAGYIPVPGDYNGDAKADLAVYDPTSYLWFYRSVSGGATTTVGFGGAGYIPVIR